MPLALAAWLPASAVADCGGEEPRIVGSTYYGTACDDTYRAPRGVTRVYGEGGDDTLYGQRGNDFLFGGPGNDRLYGGIGDDQLRGGPGDDLLSGGFGADSALDGEAGDDIVRGDATIDRIENTGGGFDTLSYATGVTPGFFNRDADSRTSPHTTNFPLAPAGRGAYINLAAGKGDNGRAPDGGGFDEEVDGEEFDMVIGTPFDDYIVGTDAAQTIYGGGGADVILGEGGGDTIYGGAEGDYCSGSATFECEFEGGSHEVDPRDPSTVSVGVMAPASGGAPALYLTGSDLRDVVTATYGGGAVTFSLGPGSEAGFDTGTTAAGGCGPPSGDQVACPISTSPDSVVLAGGGGDDSIVASGFPESTSVVLLGGEGVDHLTGGETEDALVDGPGDDEVHAGGGDDAVPNNEGTDKLYAEGGEDLFVDDAVCEGDLLDGGPDRDNANWANFKEAISIDMEAGVAGLVGSAGQPSCPSGSPTTLSGLEDIEGTSLGDVLIGDSGPNQLLGRPGPDRYYAGAGDDSILANSGVPPVKDPDPTIDCGEGWDTALIDFPENGPDAGPVNCEDVEERAPNSFRPPGTPPESESADSGSIRPASPCAQSRSHCAANATAPPAGEAGLHAAKVASRGLRPRLERGRLTLPLPDRPAAVPPLPLASRLPPAARPPRLPRLRDRRGRQPRPLARRLQVRRAPAHRPLEPKPPSPRLESLSASTSTGSGRPTGTTTSCAIRSPGSTRKISAGSVLSSSTRTSPR